MRPAVAIILLAWCSWAQFKSTVPLVVAPTTVKDSKGRFVDGLTSEDLILYDNNVPQTIQMDWMTYPIDLVVAVQTGEASGAVIDKVGGSGILFSQLVAAEAGETAVITFSDEVTVRQEFTADPDRVTRALKMLRKDGAGATTLDAMRHALRMLEQRPPGRRRIVLMIAEKRDRSSAATLAQVMEQAQRQNAAVYWLTYSPFLQPFTVKPKTKEDLKPEAERIKRQECALCPKPDLSALFTKTTGGRSIGFFKKNGLEEAIQAVGEEVHRQYILSFQPKGSEARQFRAIRAEVKNRPKLEVRTREGYWSLQ